MNSKSDEKVQYNYYSIFCQRFITTSLAMAIIFFLFRWFLNIEIDLRNLFLIFSIGFTIVICINIYTYATAPYLQIFVSKDGIRWNTEKIIPWERLANYQVSSFFKSEQLRFEISANEYYVLEFNHHSRKSLIRLLKKYCPKEHVLYKVAEQQSVNYM